MSLSHSPANPRSSDTTAPDRSAWPEVGALREIGAEFYRKGWSVGTSSNYSVVLRREPLRLLITASGRDKGRLSPRDFVAVDGEGQKLFADDPKASAETLLHTAVVNSFEDVGAVLHTHSVWGTVLSDLYGDDGGLTLMDYEMLKGLDGVSSHQHEQWVTIFENTQDIPALAEELRRLVADPDADLQHGFLIRNHGLYTWGRTLEDARRHVEIFEFLFEVVARRLQLSHAMRLSRDV